MERCEGCGFAWETVAVEEVPVRLAAAAGAMAALVCAAPDAKARPQQGRWSPAEYAGHLRDVFLQLRERLVLTLVEDGPIPKPMYRDERVDLGLYAADTAEALAAELVMTAGLFNRFFTALSAEQLERTCVYGFPTIADRSILWLGQQAVHEAEHHLADVRGS